MAASTLFQYGLSAVGPILVSDLDISRALYGSMLTVYFATCAIGSFFLGPLVERLGPLRSNYLLYICGGIGLLFATLPLSLVSLYIGIIFSGVAGALANPATNLLLMSVRRRRVSVAIKQSGVQISTVIAGFVLAPIAEHWGWRAAFSTLVVVILVLLMLLMATHFNRVAPASSIATSRNAASSLLPWFALYALLMGGALSMTIGYLPLYSFSLLGSEALSGMSLAVFGLFASSGRILWGYAGERVPYFYNSGRTLVLLSMLAFVAVSLLLGAMAIDKWLLVPGAVLMGLSGAAWNGVVMASIIDYSPRASSSRTTGRVQAAFFLGMGLTPSFFGYLVDVTNGYLVPWLVAGAIYLCALSIAVARIYPIISNLEPSSDIDHTSTAQ